MHKLTTPPIVRNSNKLEGKTVKTTRNSSGPVVNGTGRYQVCTACGHQNLPQAEICFNCAVPMGLNCPGCHNPVPSNSKFCGQCGTRLSSTRPVLSPVPENGADSKLHGRIPAGPAEKIGAASVKTIGERREITVLFVDVSNFTAASHQLDSEEVYLLVDEAMSLLSAIVYKYEGTIDKFTGDGLMALFGAPVAHENGPERAIRAALEMQSVIQPLQQRVKQTYGFDFQLRIGINTGQVIAGIVGSNLHMDYTVVGQTVNLASYLEMAAEPGSILVSTDTFQRAKTLFEFKQLPPLIIEWLPDTVQAFRVVGLRPTPRRQNGLSTFQPYMIGRAGELTWLRNAFDQTETTGRGHVVFISGEAGLGKSRLVAEFCRTLNKTRTRIYQGSCLTYARSSPLWVVAALVRDIIGLSLTASAQAQQAALKHYLAAKGLRSAEFLPCLSHVLGLESADPAIAAAINRLDAAMLQRQTHAALRQLFLTEAGLGTTLLIFKDLQWVDPASKEFLEYLIHTLPNAPLMLIFVTRDTGRKVMPRPPQNPDAPEQWLELPLHALSLTEGKQLVDQLISQDTSDAWALKQQIVRRAEGNPLYIEEITRMLIDRDGLVRDPATGRWQITDSTHKLLHQVPDTVKGLILARFDQLPESVRQTLQIASVFGASFPVSLIQAVSNINAEATAQYLEQLEARQFLSTYPFHSEPGYVFKHALTHETIYRTLIKRDRRIVHTRVAQAVESGNLWLPEEQTEMLAYHYAESTYPANAVPYLISAAENAARRCAHETAIRHYEQAMKLFPDSPDRPGEAFSKFR